VRVVFELETGQNLSDIRDFLRSLEAKGEVELVDSFNQESLKLKYVSIEYSIQRPLAHGERILQESIFIPDNHAHIRIDKKEINHVEADGSYIKVFTKSRKYQVSSNLKVFSLQLNDTNFIRVSRKHLINALHLYKINGNTLHVGPYEIQISKLQRKNILERFPILHTKATTQ
jgi:DNA-binding LytR/AlgR family response regulator